MTILRLEIFRLLAVCSAVANVELFELAHIIDGCNSKYLALICILHGSLRSLLLLGMRSSRIEVKPSCCGAEDLLFLRWLLVLDQLVGSSGIHLYFRHRNPRVTLAISLVFRLVYRLLINSLSTL